MYDVYVHTCTSKSVNEYHRDEGEGTGKRRHKSQVVV